MIAEISNHAETKRSCFVTTFQCGENTMKSHHQREGNKVSIATIKESSQTLTQSSDASSCHLTYSRPKYE